MYLTMAADVASRAWAKQQAIILLGEAIKIAEPSPSGSPDRRPARPGLDADRCGAVHRLGRGLDWLIERRRVTISPSPTSPVRGPPSGWPTPPVWSRTAPPPRTSRSISTTPSFRVAHSPRDPRPKPCEETSRQRSRRGSGSRTRGGRTARRLVREVPGDAVDDVVLDRRLRDVPRHGDQGPPIGTEASNLEASVTSACNGGLALVGPRDTKRASRGSTERSSSVASGRKDRSDSRPRDEHAGGRPPRDR